MYTEPAAIRETPAMEQELLARQVRLLFTHARPAILIALAMGVVYLVLMWMAAPRMQLLAWLSAIALVSGIRLMHVKAYFRSHPTFQQLKRWLQQYVAGAGVAGMLWGSAGVLFMPESQPVYQLVTVMLLMGLTAAASTTYASSLLAYRMFLWLAMTPLCITFVSRADVAHLAAGAVVLIYMLMMSQRAAVMVNNMIVSSLRQSLKLTELRDLNASIINHTESGITVYKPSGECVLMNDAAIRILGLPAHMDASHNFRTTSGWQEHGLIELADTVLQSGVKKSLDIPMRSIYGWEIWIAAHLHRITQGDEPRLLIVFTEISPQRHPQ